MGWTKREPAYFGVGEKRIESGRAASLRRNPRRPLEELLADLQQNPPPARTAAEIEAEAAFWARGGR